MITELRAQNFKSWQDTGKLQFAPLTGLFGANSSGKTSILQVLLMLKQTAEQPSDWNLPLYFGSKNSPVYLGDFDAVIHRHKQDLRLGISVSWKLPKVINTDFGSTNFLSFSTSVVKKHEGVELEYFSYEFGEKIFQIAWTDQGYMVIPGNRHASTMSADPFRCYGVANPTGLQEPFLHLQAAFENQFSQIRYLGPLREHPRHRYTWEGDHPKDIGQHGEKTISAMLSSRIRRLPIDEQIPKWLQRLELIDSYDLHPISDRSRDYEFLVKKYKDGPEVRLTDVGFGVSQVLPVLILCYYASKGSILILEQPEAHLHPKVQTELADVLIDAVTNRNIQIILESHSEYLLSRLQRRIAEGQISSDDTTLYFCQINDGTSEIEQLDVDEYGNIRNWPQDFFGDVTGELIKKTKVEMQQRKVMN